MEDTKQLVRVVGAGDARHARPIDLNVDVISQLENYAITKEALEVLKKDPFFIFHHNESYT